MRVASQYSSYMSWYRRCRVPPFLVHQVFCSNHFKTNHLQRLHWHNVGYTQEYFQLVDEWFHSGQWRKHLCWKKHSWVFLDAILHPKDKIYCKYMQFPKCFPSFSVVPLPCLNPPKRIIYEYCTRIMSRILRNILRLLMKYFISLVSK